MKTKSTTINTIKAKLILALLESAGLAGVCLLILCIVFIIASASMQFAIFFYKHLIAFTLLFFAIFVVLVIIFFLLLIRNSVKYLEDITKTLESISDDNLDINIPVKTSDELGIMAETVNNMAYKLKTAIEEERRLEKTKNDLITNISHDLRTPLTSTLGYLELINNTKLDDKKSLQKYINIAYTKCKDLKILIDDLFEYSKLNNAEIVIDKTKISVGELLEQVIIGFIPALNEAGMEYRLFFSDEKLVINADPLLLTRVFNNLITNAISYGKEGKYLDVELIEANNDAVIRIINYGKTIPEVDLPNIFKRFYQVNKSRSGINGNSGLGLAIVKRIIEMHNGSIRASSQDNKTVFEVRLLKNK